MEEMDKVQTIEDLLAGELSANEQAILREEIAKDPALQALLKDEETLVEGIRQWSRNELKKKLQALDKEMEQTPKSQENTTATKSTNWKPLLAAAGISILLTLYFIFGGGATSDELFQKYYEPYQAYASVISRGVETEADRLTVAMKAYENGEYTKAIQQFETIAAGEQRDFYLAQSYLAVGEHFKALPLLEQLSETGAEPKSSINWYLALSYLKGENISYATEVLQRLATYDNSYQMRAKELLKEL